MKVNDKIPIFPLPNVILFPGMVLPLHIFENKYRDMVDDLIDKNPEDRLIAITCMKVKNDGRYSYEKICTVGQLISVKFLDDGRSNILIQGKFTAEVKPIPNQFKPYLNCEIKLIREEYWKNPYEDKTPKYYELLESIDSMKKRTNLVINNIEDYEFEDLINGIAFSFNLNSELKQQLLETQEYEQRLKKLIEIIDKIGHYVNYKPDVKKFKEIN